LSFFVVVLLAVTQLVFFAIAGWQAVVSRLPRHARWYHQTSAA